jgi:hypothetical protein
MDFILFPIDNSSSPKKLRLPVVRIPSGVTYPSTYEIVAPWDKVGIQGIRLLNDLSDFGSDIRGASFVRIQAEDPIMNTGINGSVAQLSETFKGQVYHAGAESFSKSYGGIRAVRINHNDVIGP